MPSDPAAVPPPKEPRMTPALDALLKDVEALNAPGTIRVTMPTMSSPVIGGPDSLTTRLAAMLRVAVYVMQMTQTTNAGWRMSQDALARIEAMAKGS